MEKIDYPFIHALEGVRTIGYVPQTGGRVIGKSGVTVGAGIDLGQRNFEELKNLSIDEALKIKLRKYIGLKGDDAVKILKRDPLILTQSETTELNTAVYKVIINQLARYYDKHSKVLFEDLPPRAQTVLASLAINFGPNLPKAIPVTWRAATNQQWGRVKRFLEAFPSKQLQLAMRRKKEAEYLSAIV